jgi:lipid-A-disaccharide synthase-like uncharacterized protein
VGDYWELLGYAGTAIFGCRFFVQWIASERAGRSVVPKVFWHISILGTLVMLLYAIFVTNAIGLKKGLPLILAYAPNAFVYFRNLMLIDKHEKAGPPAPADAATVEVSHA